MNTFFRAGAAACIAAGLMLGCGTSGSSSPSSSSNTNTTGTKKGQIRTVTGSLKSIPAGKKVAVAAKTKDGKELKAVIDPKTNKWSINLPKGQPAQIALNVEGVIRKIKFPKNLKVGKTDATADEFDYSIPDDAFVGDADLGALDWTDDNGAGDITCGDDPDENSIFEFSDADGDGKSDWEDPDMNWATDEAWEDAAGKAEEWFDSNDLCDLDADTAGLCEPKDAGEFFSEDDCSKPEAAEWCFKDGEKGFYEAAGQNDWWNGEDGGDTGAACKSACGTTCKGEATCVATCEKGCDAAGTGGGTTGGTDIGSCEGACEATCKADEGCLGTCLKGCDAAGTGGSTGGTDTGSCKDLCEKGCQGNAMCIEACGSECSGH